MESTVHVARVVAVGEERSAIPPALEDDRVESVATAMEARRHTRGQREQVAPNHCSENKVSTSPGSSEFSPLTHHSQHGALGMHVCANQSSVEQLRSKGEWAGLCRGGYSAFEWQDRFLKRRS